MREKSESKSLVKMGLTVLLCTVLALSLLPLGSANVAQAYPEYPTQSDEEISTMLGQGEYVEGEAIVVVDESSGQNMRALGSSGLLDSSKQLMSVSEEVYEAAIAGEAVTQSPSQNQNQRTAQVAEDQISIRHITAGDMSTEQLLYALRDDSRVLKVEPNYLYQLDTPANTNVLAQSLLPTADTADLTDYQWGNDNNDKVMVVAGKEDNFDINPPTWNSSDNAVGTVAVMDTGIDYEHPDLKDIIRDDMTNFVNSGGAHGYNSSAEDDPRDPMDCHSHGTHCAGIIASEWNDFGTSGVASGVKLVAVRAATQTGAFTSSATIDGYAYLAEAMKNGLDLKAVNNSWGGGDTSFAFSIAVTELGNLGAISLVASGNNSANVDQVANSSSMLQANPYAVVVNASNMKAELSDFSNFGSATTNIVAPGSQILSTYPLAMSQYLPTALKNPSANLVYEGFNSPTSLFATYNDADYSGVIGARDNTYHFDGDAWSWSVDMADLPEANAYNYPARQLYATVDVPASMQNDARYLAFDMYASGTSSSDVALVYIKGKNDKGEKVWEESLHEADRGEWSHISIDLTESASEEGFTPDYENDRLEVLVEYLYYSSDLNEPGQIYVDAVGVGADGVATPYAFASGTSMATPAATGAAMVISTADNASLDPSTQALLRAAGLEASVRPLAAFANVCTSGGALDLDYFQTQALSPVISTAEVNASQGETVINIKGQFFGTAQGNVSVGGVSASVVNGTWTDESVTVVCPSSLSSGTHSVVLTTSSGATAQKSFLFELMSPPAQSTTPLFETTYSLPFNQEGFPKAIINATMVGLGGALYLFPLDAGQEGGATDTAWRLEPKTGKWTKCSAMPASLAGISATTYEGKLVVTGLALDTEEQKTHLYDPVSETWSTWDLAIPYFAAIVNCEETLYFFGGQDIDDNGKPYELDTILRYNAKTKAIEQVGTLTEEGSSLIAAAHENKVMVMQTSHQGSEKSLVDLITMSTGEVKDVSSALPAFADDRQNDCGIASLKQGFVLSGASGVTDVNGALDDQDTYVLAAPDFAKTRFEPFQKRASHAQLFYATATSHQGLLYTIGGSYYEEKGIVLRATKVETLDQPGDLHATGPGDPVDPSRPNSSNKSDTQVDQNDLAGDIAYTGDTFGPALIFTLVAVVAICTVAIVLVSRRNKRNK